MPEETEVMTESTEPVDNLEASDHIEVDEGPAVDEPMYTVKVDGEEMQIPESELLNGYQRQADTPVKRRRYLQNVNACNKPKRLYPL